MEMITGYKGKRPAEIPAKVSMTIVMLYWIRFMLLVNKFNRLELIVASLVIGVAATIIGILMVRLLTFSRKIVIEIKPEALQIKNTEIEAGKVKKIFIKGYFKPVIAVKPKANLLVPYKYCFCFSDKEDQGIKDLKEWAEQHQIEVLHRRFTRWL